MYRFGRPEARVAKGIALVWSMKRAVQLELCPYDASPISIRGDDNSSVISCGACGAAWEMQGSSLHRLRAPDGETLKAVRERLFPPEILSTRRRAATETAGNAAR
jgi:hypothetical protein